MSIAVEFNAPNVTIKGNLDFDTVTLALKKTETFFSGAKHLIIDLKQVDNVDSAALALLCEWKRIARSQKCALTFEHAPQQLLNMSQLSGMGKLLGLT